MNHTIILIQKTNQKSSRTYKDYESSTLAVEDLIKSFEQKLKDLNPRTVNLNYGIDDINRYIDSFGDIAALVFEHNTMTYKPRDRAWIKQGILNYLKKAASGK